jgi:RimJ/RimL family protein N-acetyltransferase
VFVTNVASVRIWDRLGFDRIGYLKGVGRLKGYAKPIDAIMFGKELVDENGKPLHQ